MVTRNFAKYCVAAFLAVACTAQVPQEQAPSISGPVSDKGCIPGRATVEFDDAMTALIEEAEGSVVTKSAPLNALLQDLGVERMERVFPDGGEFEPRHRREGLHRFYRVRFSADKPVTKAVNDFRALPGVLSVTPAYRIYPRAVFNDPRLQDQWHLVNKSKPVADIHVEEVWKHYTVGSADVVVAVMDEVVDGTHPDLKANLWDDGAGHYGYNPILQSSQLKWGGKNAIGHGTHVAGIIAAVNNNGVGVSSMAGGDAARGIPGVRIMSVPILASTDEEDAILEADEDDSITPAAFIWAADHGAVISQNSWGFMADGILDGEQDGKVSKEELAFFRSITIDDLPSIKKGIDYFIRYAGCDNNGNQLPGSPMQGGLVFFAAGNEGDMGVDYDPIAFYEPVIAVGASSWAGNRSYFSQYGDWVDIAAPGGDASFSIWSTLPTGIDRSGYGGQGWIGTSMACPHASGAAALLVSYFGGDGFTAERCKEILLAGLGEVIGGNKPAGRQLNVMASFLYGTGEDELLEITLSDNDFTLKKHESKTLTASATAGAAISCRADTGSGLSFDEGTGVITIDALKAQDPGEYVATFTASNSSGREASVQLCYTILPNHGPRIIGFVDPIHHRSLTAATTLDLTRLFEDPDGEMLSYSVVLADESVAYGSVSGTGVALASKAVGVTSVTLLAVDASGWKASMAFPLAVSDPAHPLTVSPTVVDKEITVGVDADELTTVALIFYSATGAVALQESLQADVFTPATLDLSMLAPGRYTLSANYHEKDYLFSLVKR